MILALGDLAFGGKGQYPITPYLSVGGNLGVSLLNSVGGMTFSGDSTGFYLGMLTSFDLQPLTEWPLRFHLNFGYQLDNSNNLAKFPGYSLASLQVEKFALGINPSRLQLRFGIDAPLRRLINFGLTPILEIGADIATGDADADFVRFQKPPAGTGTLTADQIEGKSTIPTAARGNRCDSLSAPVSSRPASAMLGLVVIVVFSGSGPGLVTQP